VRRGREKTRKWLTVSQFMSAGVEVADDSLSVLTLLYLLVMPSDVIASVEEESSVSIERDQRSFQIVKDVQGLRVDSKHFTNRVENLRNVTCECIVVLRNERRTIFRGVPHQFSLKEFSSTEGNSRIRYVSTTVEPHTSNVGHKGESG